MYDEIRAKVAEDDLSAPARQSDWWYGHRTEKGSQYPIPAVLATAGCNDPRVAYWEPAKWVAKLRTANTGSKPILLGTDLGAGHSGPSGRYDAWREEAFLVAFILDQVGANDLK
ncbi:hypothetical protein BH18ACT5_BH18ACT5_05950 [soil metagenome]